ncbi:acyl carrier protein [Streptomyces sp. NBC_01426]|uniref:acyl carrier protein n=1 Tax=unclassified Streptomyces TaxID=2593676 RepID=UPI002E2F52CD|nr:acyl carrier protein [Streptomyces sp. NBC_01426]
MSDMLATVIDVLTRRAGLPSGPVKPEATLTQAGVDSMAVAVLALVLEEEHGLAITETDLSGSSTIAELAAYIESHQAATT